MTVVVSFVKPQGAGVVGMGRVRIRENISVPGTTTNAAEDGEIIIIGNAETSPVNAAWGTTPDAAATAASAATTAGVPIFAGAVSFPITPKIGEKINIKAAGVVVGPPTLNFVSSGQLTDAGANKTLTGAAIGPAVSTRQLFIAIDGNGVGQLPTSLTFTPNVGSPVVATLVEGSLVGASVYGFIYQANVPTGTTVDVTLAFATNPFGNYSYALYYADGAQMNSTTATDHKKTSGASGTSSLTLNLNASAGGFIIAVATYGATTGPTTTWSGGETYTRRLDVTTSSLRHSFADASTITGGAADAVTSSWTLSAANVQLVAASWR